LSKASRLQIFIATFAATLAICASAQAAIITLGPTLPFSGSFGQEYCEAACTLAQSHSEGAVASSPINGVVVRWRVFDASGPYKYRLQVLNPVGGSAHGYAGAGTSGPETPSGPGVETFPADLPIHVGELIGLNAEAGAPFGVRVAPSSSFVLWEPPLGDGATLESTDYGVGVDVGVDADVQPAPTITALAPASGPNVGGATVTITGTDLEGASAVSFGSLPAAGFTVASESQITAVAPSGLARTSVPVSVSTIAGTASAAQPFTYEGCVVPKLKGMKLKPSKKKVRAADCKLGRVSKLKGATSKSGKVIKQNPKPGKILAPGTKVNVRLGS
jgi:hypothetical protein